MDSFWYWSNAREVEIPYTCISDIAHEEEDYRLIDEIDDFAFYRYCEIYLDRL